jgi:hypothetical protein
VHAGRDQLLLGREHVAYAHEHESTEDLEDHQPARTEIVTRLRAPAPGGVRTAEHARKQQQHVHPGKEQEDEQKDQDGREGRKTDAADKPKQSRLHDSSIGEGSARP